LIFKKIFLSKKFLQSIWNKFLDNIELEQGFISNFWKIFYGA